MKNTLLMSVVILGLGTGIAGHAWAKDTTPPVITATVTGIQGANGWYTSNVSLTWAVTDPESRSIKKTGCGSVSLTTDTSGITYTCKATSAGGSSSKSATIKRDATLPTATITTPASGATFTLNQSVPASFACSDALAGVTTCSGSVANGVAINTSSTGTKSFTVTAVDQAGNLTMTSVSYSVTSPTSSNAGGTRLFAWNDLGILKNMPLQFLHSSWHSICLRLDWAILFSLEYFLFFHEPGTES